MKEMCKNFKEQNEGKSPCSFMKEMFEKQNTNVEPSAPQPEQEQSSKPKCEELKEKIQALKKEAKLCRKELKHKKKEQKKAKQELKKAKKVAKKRFASEVVAHLDAEEEQIAEPGTMLLKTWKVKNVGKATWSEETVASFLKGREEVVAPDCRIVPVGTIDPQDVAYIRTMFQVPTEPGKYRVVFRLNNPEAGKFGAPMRSTIVVEKPEEIVEEESEDIPYVEEEPVQEPEPQPEPFRFQEALNTMLAMGFPEEDSKSVLVAVEGNIERALEILMA